MTIARTPDGKWTLYQVSTGQAFACWPVDGRLLLASGEYTADTPTGERAPAASVAPVPDAVLPASLPLEHSPGVPLVAAREGVPADPLPTLDAPKRRSRK